MEKVARERIELQLELAKLSLTETMESIRTALKLAVKTDWETGVKSLTALGNLLAQASEKLQGIENPE